MVVLWDEKRARPRVVRESVFDPPDPTQCFLLYIGYKRGCAAECTTPVTYSAWLWLRGLSDVRPW